MRGAALLLALGGCVLYVPVDEDDVAPPDGGGPDARCPAAATGNVTICGGLEDIETSAAPASPLGLTVAAYDALEYVSNPAGAVPLPYATMRVDPGGRFEIVDLRRPSLGFVAIVVDDTAASADDHAPAVVALPVTSGETLADVRAPVMRWSTDARWTSTAGLEGDSFVERGVLLLSFRGPDGAPTEGVRVSPERAEGTYVFADTDPLRRTTVVVGDVTGVNGSALRLSVGLGETSGSGGEVPGCTWEATLAATVPGALFHAPRECP